MFLVFYRYLYLEGLYGIVQQAILFSIHPHVDPNPQTLRAICMQFRR